MKQPAFRIDIEIGVHSLRRLLAVLAGCLLLTVFRPALAFELITESEHRAALSAEREALTALTRSIEPPTQPRIEVASPDVTAGIKSPITIELRFFSNPPATVDPGSLRVLYGVLRINITERIRRAARITAEGIRSEGATLPSGTHRLLIGIGDSAGRFAEKEIRFSVE
jgi:hypothetical protein